MKNITKVGLSALAGALAMTSVNAGDLSISGSMEASYTKGSGRQTTGNPLGMDKELSITGSGELENGTTVSYKQTTTDALAFGDSELVFGNVMGTTASVAMTSTGSPISAIDDVTPTAFEEANALLGSIDDVNGMDGDYGIRVTMADVMGTGFKIDAMYTPQSGSGDAASDNSFSGVTEGGFEDGKEISITGSVPFVEGLDVGAGYYTRGTDASGTADATFVHDEGTAYIKYSTGPVSVGYQKGAVNTASGSAETYYLNEMIGISYKVTDDLSVSYNELESTIGQDGVNVSQEFDSISLSYSVGGMTIGIADADVSNDAYTTGRSADETSVSLSVAF
jgi:outer membrane protein OmpU